MTCLRAHKHGNRFDFTLIARGVSFWGAEARDTYPVEYRMNTRRALRESFERAGFDELTFARLDDLWVFDRFGWLHQLELLSGRALKLLGLPYPECCLLAVYRRRPTSRRAQASTPT